MTVEDDDSASDHTPPAAAGAPSFEQALARLERIVSQLEEGELGLAPALAQYEEGVKLLRQCYGLLQLAEQRVEVLCAVDPQQHPLTGPFHDDAGTPDEEKARSRSRRRTSHRPAGERLPPQAETASLDDAPPSRPEPRGLF